MYLLYLEQQNSKVQLWREGERDCPMTRKQLQIQFSDSANKNVGYFLLWKTNTTTFNSRKSPEGDNYTLCTFLGSRNSVTVQNYRGSL